MHLEYSARESSTRERHKWEDQLSRRDSPRANPTRAPRRQPPPHFFKSWSVWANVAVRFLGATNISRNPRSRPVSLHSGSRAEFLFVYDARQHLFKEGRSVELEGKPGTSGKTQSANSIRRDYPRSIITVAPCFSLRVPGATCRDEEDEGIKKKRKQKNGEMREHGESLIHLARIYRPDSRPLALWRGRPGSGHLLIRFCRQCRAPATFAACT